MAKKHTEDLTAKQQAFVYAYLTNGYNGTQAAKQAGYKGNDQTLGQVAYENLRKPDVAAQIRRHEIDNQRRFKSALDDIQQFLLAVLHFDPREANEPSSVGSQPYKWDEMPKHVRSAVREIQTIYSENGTRHVLTPYCKMQAVDRLARYFGMQKGSDAEAGRTAHRSSVANAIERLRQRFAGPGPVETRGDSGTQTDGDPQGGE